MTEFICEYLYGVILAIKASLEAVASLAESLLLKISNLFRIVFQVIAPILQAMIETILDLLRTVFKMVANLINGIGISDILCTRLFNCIYLLQSILNGDNVIGKTFRKFFSPQICFINNVLSDLSEFNNSFCKFGFTFSIGTELLKSMLMSYKGFLLGYIKTLENKRKEWVAFCRKYIKKLKNWKIFDFLEQLKAFIECVLDESDICASIKTAGHLYADYCSKLKIEEDGMGSFKINAEWSNSFESKLGSMSRTCHQMVAKIDDMYETMVDKELLKQHQRAFNLSKLFDGIDIAHPFKTLKETTITKYFTVRYDEFLTAFIRDYPSAEMDPSKLADYMHFDGDRIWLEIPRYEYVNCQMYEYTDIIELSGDNYKGCIHEIDLDIPIVLNGTEDFDMGAGVFDNTTGEFKSTIAAAYEIANGSKLKDVAMSEYNKFQQFVNIEDLAVKI